MYLLLLLLFTTNAVESYKILVYSAPLGYSHMQFMGRMADILQEAGHDVTVLHPVWMPKYLHGVSKKAKQVLFDLPKEIKNGLDPRNLNVWDMESWSILQQLILLRDHTALQIQSCDLLLGDNGTIQTLKSEGFDVGISEIMGGCGFGVFKKIGVNHAIGASAMGLVDTMAEFYDAPKFPSFVPSFLLPITDKMSFVERIINFVTGCITHIAARIIIHEYEKVFERHGINCNEEDFYRSTNYLLSNSDEFLEFARPVTAKIVHVGGIGLAEKAPLSTEFRELLERKKRNGVVYISFGSVIPTTEMPPYFREAIIHVARTFPSITFIWKIDIYDTAPDIQNLHAFTWLPQQAILEHPNLLCFVSHAGINSVLEVTRSGKPSILVPIFGDQFRNARVVESKNTTIVLMKENFNRHSFETALRRILSESSYAVNAKRLASLMVNKPFPLKERLLATVEFSTRHGKIENLDSYGRNLNTLQYYSIDVVVFIITVVTITIAAFVQIVLICKRNFISMKQKLE